MQPTIVQKGEIVLVGMSFYGDPFETSAGWTEENQIGWVIDYSKEAIQEWYHDLIQNFPQNIQSIIKQIQKKKEEHTWKQRAQTVVEALGPSSSST